MIDADLFEIDFYIFTGIKFYLTYEEELIIYV